MEGLTKADFDRLTSRWFFRSRRAGSAPGPDDLDRLLSKDDLDILRRVPQEQFDVLKRLYVRSQAALISAIATDEPAAQDSDFRSWALNVLQTTVEMRANRYALLRHPSADFSVEINWIWDRKKKSLRPSALHVIADDELHMSDVGSLDNYVAAFFVHNVISNFRPVTAPRKWPAPGQPFDTGWYADLLKAYNQLKQQGHKAPAAELARLSGKNPSTIRSYLHRARQHLEKEN